MFCDESQYIPVICNKCSAESSVAMVWATGFIAIQHKILKHLLNSQMDKAIKLLCYRTVMRIVVPYLFFAINEDNDE